MVLHLDCHLLQSQKNLKRTLIERYPQQLVRLIILHRALVDQWFRFIKVGVHQVILLFRKIIFQSIFVILIQDYYSLQMEVG